jgi:hypothetical protein
LYLLYHDDDIDIIKKYNEIWTNDDSAFKKNNPDKAEAPLIGISYNDKMMHEKAHQHQRAQLIYSIQGSFQLHFNEQYFSIPPIHAVGSSLTHNILPQALLQYTFEAYIWIRIIFYPCQKHYES